jgi:predicted TIM-barrel fold metal-dependent hydrolase
MNKANSTGGAMIDMDQPVIVFSHDNHISPSNEDLVPYLPKENVKDFEAHLKSATEKLSSMMATVPTGLETFMARDALNQSTGGGSDIHAHIRDMDRAGVAGNIIMHGGSYSPFPFANFDFIFGSISSEKEPTAEELRLLRIGMRTYNRWLADAVSVDPQRFVGVAHMPYWDPEACLEEVIFAGEAGLSGMMLPPPRIGFIEYDRTEWDRVWEACAQRNIHLQTHLGAVVPDQFTTYLTRPSPKYFSAIAAMEGARWPNYRALHRLVFGGVFERYPNLKLIFTETENFWNQALIEMDLTYDACYDSLQEILPRRPSEYCRTNVLIGASFMSRYEAKTAVRGGWTGNFMWGIDYPHPEGCWKAPESDDEESTVKLNLRDTFCEIAPEDTLKFIGENAIRVYGLDRERLQEKADSINALTLNQIGRPVPRDEIPGLDGFVNPVLWGAFHKPDPQATIDRITGGSR